VPEVPVITGLIPNHTSILAQWVEAISNPLAAVVTNYSVQ
jgi:hypothetical protein